jgi:hypothetical protein
MRRPFRFRSSRAPRPIALAFALAAGLASVAIAPTDAQACGGCFHQESPTESPSVVTDHRMALAVSPTMTTLWDQIQYSGDPKDFAWVLPIHGAVAVGVGSASFMDSLDQLTAPTVHGPQPTYCPVSGGGGGGCMGSASADYASGAYLPTSDDSGVIVTAQSTVGPYETVQLHGTGGAPILAWLKAHGYAVPTAIEPVLAGYVKDGFDFLAIRLQPNQGVRAMRPIRVSWSGADPRLPLKMVAAGVGAVVGIKLFVIADGRWHTKNYPTVAIDPSTLSWDFSAQKSNYVEQRNALEAQWGGRAWVMESSSDIAPQQVPLGSDTPYVPPFDLDAGADTALADTGVDAATTTDAGADTATTTDAAADAADEAAADSATDASAPTDAGADAADEAGADGASVPAHDTGTASDTATAPDTSPAPYDAGQPPAVDPSMSDVELAFGTKPQQRITRLRADLPAKFLDTDLELEADAYQAALSKDLYVTKSTNDVVCSSDSNACVVGSGEGRTALRTPAGIAAAVAIAALVRRLAKRK